MDSHKATDDDDFIEDGKDLEEPGDDLDSIKNANIMQSMKVAAGKASHE